MTGHDPNLKLKDNNNEIQLLHKYSTTLKNLDSLPDQAKKPVISLIETLNDEFS